MRTDAPYLSSLLLSEVRVEAPSRDVSADRIGVVSVATEDEEFASDITQLRVGVVVHGVGAGGSTREQFLHLRAPIAIVVVQPSMQMKLVASHSTFVVTAPILL